MSTTLVRSGQHEWTLTLENGETRKLIAPSLGAAIWGCLSAPVVSAQRGNAVDPAAPTSHIAALVPPTAALGAANFTLRVTGTDFRSSDVILWKGLPVVTAYVSPTEVTAGVNMAAELVALAVPVSVRSLTGQESNAATFTLTATVEGQAVPEHCQ